MNNLGGTLVKKAKIITNIKRTIPINIIVIIGKIVIGIFTSSFFMFINALYTLGITIAKYLSLKTNREIQLTSNNSLESRKREYSNYYVVGIIILISSIIYAIYSINHFLGSTSTNYTLIVGIAIATFTFTELTMAIIGLVSARKNRDILSETIKLIYLASSLISLVLTQTAILSFSHEGDVSFYNGLSGIIFGCLAAIIGIYMIIYTHFAIEKIGTNLHYKTNDDIII